MPRGYQFVALIALGCCIAMSRFWRRLVRVMCGRRLAVKHYVWQGDDCGPVQSCVWPVGAAILTAAGPDVIREPSPDHIHGLDTRDPKKVFPPRRPTDRLHAVSTSATRDALTACSSRPGVAIVRRGRGNHRIAKPYPVAAHACARYWGARWPAS